MTDMIDAEELINIAIDIERRGISFYDVMARSTDNVIARETFEALAEMERDHLHLFQSMLGETANDIQEFTAAKTPGYIRTLVNEAVFSDDLVTSETAMQADSDIKAVELGISAEKDSLLFYYEIKDSIPQPLIPTIDRIIAEEKFHLQQLSAIKEKLAGSS
jgi:rubrerythrin